MNTPVSLPVHVRVGDGQEITVGTIDVDSLDELLIAVPAFWRALADASEKTLAAVIPRSCTASLVQPDGILSCVLPVRHDHPQHGRAHHGPGDPFSRLWWHDHAHGAVPHQDRGASG